MSGVRPRRTLALTVCVSVSGTEVPNAVRTSLAALFPEDVAPEAFTSQFLQRHSSSAKAVVAVARVTSPPGEVEELVFGLLRPDSSLDVEVRLLILGQAHSH